MKFACQCRVVAILVDCPGKTAEGMSLIAAVRYLKKEVIWAREVLLVEAMHGMWGKEEWGIDAQGGVDSVVWTC
jgi:hypothetical protein